MQLRRLLRPLGILVFSLLLVCRANADLYVTATALLITTGGARFNETTGMLSGTFASRLAFGPDGNLYVAVERSGFGFEVDRFDRLGNPLNVVVSPLPGLDITDLTFGLDGNFYMAVTNESSENEVLRLNGRTGQLEIFVNLFSRANFMTFGPDGSLYITPILVALPSVWSVSRRPRVR
jgi:sugar lactone lactonase YvrE